MKVSDYLSFITSEHAAQPNFRRSIAALVGPLVGLQTVLDQMGGDAFDLDLATGAQLDIVGQWVGVSRNLQTPLTGVYFSWRDTAADGWRSGTWQGPNDPSSGLTQLPDDVYRTLLYAKIAANSWNGTIPGAYAVWAVAFTGSFILIIQDNQDMSMTIGIAGQPMPIVEQTLLTGGYLPLRPAGVRIAYYAIVPAPGPLFAWRVNSGPAVAGWRTGQWGNIVLPS